MGLAPNQTRRELSGGARLLTAALPDRSSASLVLMFSVGSRYEEDPIGGASHFVEHLFFKGTRRRPTAKAIAEAIEGVGGVMNASTDKEVTVYWCRVPAERLGLATDVLCDIVTDSQLAPTDVERERMVILEELKMYLDQPQDYVHSLFEEIMWPGHSLGRDIIGTAQSVAGTTREQLLAYIQAQYSLRNLVVGLSGSIDPDRSARELEARLQLPAGGDGRIAPVPELLASPQLLLQAKKTEQAHICLHSFTSKHRDAGYFAVYMGVDPKKAEEAVNSVLGILREISEQSVPEEELTKAKEYMKGRLRLGLEGTNSLASWLCQQELLMGEVRTVSEVTARIDAVTPEDVRRVAQRVLDQPIRMAMIGPFKSEAPFLAAIGA